MARFVSAYLPAFGVGAPAKLTAEQTAAALPHRAALVPPRPDPRRDLRCEDHARTPDARNGREGAWDYLCTYIRRPDTGPERVQVGVRVDHHAIKEMSQEYALDAPHVR